MEIVFIILIIAVVAAVAYIGHLQTKKRREAMAALAMELGWSFSPHESHAGNLDYTHFDLFRKGHSRRAYNTLHGSVVIDQADYFAIMGDFRYKTSHTNSKGQRRTTTHRFSYLILDVPYVGVPDLLIRREGIFDKLAGVIGFDDIDFESAEFSRRFHVKSSDRKFAYDVITPGVMEFLMASDAPAVDIEHGRCCMSDGSRTWPIEGFRARLGWICEFFDRWPEHVRVDLAARSGMAS